MIDLTRQSVARMAAFPTRLGWMAIVQSDGVLRRLTFGHDSSPAAFRGLDTSPWDEIVCDDDRSSPLVARLKAYAQGAAIDFSDVEIDCGEMTPFQRRVIDECRAIPFGQTRAYGQLAARAGSPRAAQAVGNIMATNCTPLVVPCHRVVPTSGRYGGYSAGEGVRTKLRLLEMESCGD